MTVVEDKELQCQPEPFVIKVSSPDVHITVSQRSANSDPF